MELDHEFTVATDADTAWPVLLDVERMHPLMPGVVYESGADGEYRGRLKVKFGPTTITYRGTVRLAVVDDLTRTAILEVSAREARGQGTVTGSFQAVVLPAAPSSSRVALHTRLSFSGGRAATLGEHLVHDTGAKLLTRFATNLNTLLTTPAKPEPTLPAEPEPTVVIEAKQPEPPPPRPRGPPPRSRRSSPNHPPSRSPSPPSRRSPPWRPKRSSPNSPPLWSPSPSWSWSRSPLRQPKRSRPKPSPLIRNPS